jgi:hypothetical protein
MTIEANLNFRFGFKKVQEHNLRLDGDNVASYCHEYIRLDDLHTSVPYCANCSRRLTFPSRYSSMSSFASSASFSFTTIFLQATPWNTTLASR